MRLRGKRMDKVIFVLSVVVLIAMLMLATLVLSGCMTRVQVLRPDGTMVLYEHPSMFGQAADEVSFTRDGDDYLFQLKKYNNTGADMALQFYDMGVAVGRGQQ